MNTTPVYRKSEFWVTLATSVSGLLLAFGVITPEQSSGIAAAVPQIVGGIMALVSSIKFVGEQNKAKMAVFHAVCALSSGKGEISAQSAVKVQVVGNARAVGL